MTHSRQKRWIFIIGGFFLVFVSVLWMWGSLLGKSAASVEAMPNPNGYDDFVAAGNLLFPNFVINDYDTASIQDLKRLVVTNQEALARARIGLKKQCRVPFDFPKNGNPVNPSIKINTLMSIKCVAYNLHAEARLAEMENRPSDAVKMNLDCIEYGIKASRGGTMIDDLVGIACGKLAIPSVRTNMTVLNIQQSRENFQRLQKICEQSEPFEAVLKTEKSYQEGMARQYNPYTRFILKIIMRSQEQKSENNCKAKHLAMNKELLLLQIALASHIYHMEKGTEPKSIKDLVPEFFKTVPIDPVTHVEMTSLHDVVSPVPNLYF